MGQGRLRLLIRRLRASLAALLVAFFWCGAPAAIAQEAILEESPPPSSVEESVGPIDRAFESPPERLPLTARLRELLSGAPTFLRDSKLGLNVRSYYLARENYGDAESEACALGGSIAYRSGDLFERLVLGAAGYTSQPLHAPEDRSGTRLLDDEQEGYAVVGQAYGELKLLDGLVANLFRKEYNTPFLNRHDGRMTPNTFEGYTLVGTSESEERSLRYGGGYVTKIKERDADHFRSMSEAAGAGVERGVAFLGAKYGGKTLSFGAIDYYSEDIINILYAEAGYTLLLEGGLGFALSAQYADQRSTGDELLANESFATHQASFAAEASFGGALLSVAYSDTASDADMQSPWSSYPGFTGAQVQDFNRAGEEAILVRASSDLSRLGLAGATVYAQWARGWNRIDPATNESAIDEDEYDFDLQWRPKGEPWNGLWLRARYAHVDQRGASGSIDEVRLIFNYDFALL